MRTSDLTTELTAEYGDVVPPSLIASAVASAAGPARAAANSEQLASETARADVAALAEAVRRATDVQPA